VLSSTEIAAFADTTPPTAPSGLAATIVSSSQINLSWTASTDSVGVTGYLVERCSGASCSSFVQIGTPTTTTYSDTGLAASTSYSYRVRATDAAGNLSSYSGVASGTTSAGSGDTTPPTAPSSLTSSVVSATQINLTWTASTDNVGVTAYLLERCSGASCTTFAQIALPTTTSYSDSGLTASTSYSYRVRATDAAGNLGGYSNTTTGTTTAAGGSTPPVISTPATGTVVTSGQSTMITVSITTGQFPNGVAIFGEDPLGNTDVQIPTGSAVTLTFSVPIPANTPSGTYALTAVGSTSPGTIVMSAPIALSVERADQPTSIQVFPGSMSFGSIGDTRSIFVLGIFSDGSQIALSNSTQLTISSENTAVATVQNGIVTSVASGQTNIDVNYGRATLTIPVSVP
jgi:chitodextrinase